MKEHKKEILNRLGSRYLLLLQLVLYNLYLLHKNIEIQYVHLQATQTIATIKALPKNFNLKPAN